MQDTSELLPPTGLAQVAKESQLCQRDPDVLSSSVQVVLHLPLSLLHCSRHIIKIILFLIFFLLVWCLPKNHEIGFYFMFPVRKFT